MRQVLLVAFGAIIVVSLVFGLFAINQVNQEQISRKSLLQSRTQVLADSLAESIEPSYNARATSPVQRLVDRFVSSEGLPDSAFLIVQPLLWQHPEFSPFQILQK